MLRSGKEHLKSIRDGRIVYIGSERVDDVTRHPAFRNAAQTVAALYDMKADPALREEMAYEEDGGRHSIYFLRARSRDDLQRRMIGHRRIADFTYGMFGRSPDHVSSFVTGMAMKADELRPPCGHPDNLLAYYRHIRDNDIYPVYAVVPPQAARNPEFYHRQNLPVPTLRVVREDDNGVIISGMKMLATGALFANEIWIGNVIPLAPDQKKSQLPAPSLATQRASNCGRGNRPRSTACPNSIYRSPTGTTRATACCCATRCGCHGSVFSSTTMPSCLATFT